MQMLAVFHSIFSDNLSTTMKTRLSILSSLLLSCAASADSTPTSQSDSLEQRQAAVETQLQSEASTVCFHTAGLYYPSCEIDIREKVSKLDFVDQYRFHSGVALDLKHQLVLVAVKAGHKADTHQLASAIEAAGYVPDQYFNMTPSGLHTTAL